MANPKRSALVILFDGVEELEAVAPIDLLRRAGIDVTLASINGAPQVTGRNGIVLGTDCPLDGLDPLAYDLLFLPGGPGVLALLDDGRITSLLQRRNESAREIAAICAAPKVLAAAGLLEKRRATSHISVRGDIPNLSLDPIVEDGHIVTSQGAGTAVDFGLVLVRRLCGETVANEVASSIHR